MLSSRVRLDLVLSDNKNITTVVRREREREGGRKKNGSIKVEMKPEIDEHSYGEKLKETAEERYGSCVSLS